MPEQQEVAYNRSNPYPWYRYMRETQPVFYDQERKRWYLFRYEDVQRAFLNPHVFSSKGIAGGGFVGASFMATDPPYHRQLRALVSQTFTPRQIARLETRIQEIVRELLDAVVAAGEMDVITDLASPLASMVITELLDVPRADREQFKQWIDRIFEDMGSSAPLRDFSAQATLAAYVLQLIEMRRREPTDDFISGLLAAETEGQKLSDTDIQNTCVLLLVAGHETTANLIGNAIYCFTEQPQVLAELRADPELVPGAIEEALRYHSPVSSTPRIAAVNTQIGTNTIKAGDFVFLVSASANRDESVFVDPDRFDIRRTPNRHFGFGHGIHFCLGAPLARLEGKIALTAMLERLPDLHRIPERPLEVEVVPSGLFQGTKHLPIAFTPTARVM